MSYSCFGTDGLDQCIIQQQQNVSITFGSTILIFYVVNMYTEQRERYPKNKNSLVKSMSRDIYYDLCTFIDKLKASRGRKSTTTTNTQNLSTKLVVVVLFSSFFFSFFLLCSLNFPNMYAMVEKKEKRIFRSSVA